MLCLIFATLACIGQAFAWTDGFIKAQGTQFTLNGNAFFVVGTNNYYINYETQDAITSVLQTAQSIGVNVIRASAFLDSPMGTIVFQAPDANGNVVVDTTSPNGIVHLDNMLVMAKQYGIRLILGFTTNWDYFGGVGAYNTWSGNTYHDQFFTNPKTIAIYQNYLQTVITRTNTLNNIPYIQDDTIMAWELINEPRCGGTSQAASPQCTTATLISWVGQQAAFIKQLDPNHLVGVGDEGFFDWPNNYDWAYDGSQGDSFSGFLWSQNIDFGTFHLYPIPFGKDPGDWSTSFINNHIQQGQAAGKPVLMEEYGYEVIDQRIQYYTAWESLMCNGGAGVLSWMLAGQLSTGWFPSTDGLTFTAEPTQQNADMLAHFTALSQKVQSGACSGASGNASIASIDTVNPSVVRPKSRRTLRGPSGKIGGK